MESPPTIKLPAKKTGSRLLVPVLLALVAVLSAVVFLIYLATPRPPKESQLIQNFYTNRAAFERLRDMLRADEHLRRVAGWGVETSKPFHLGPVSDSSFPMDRYRQYLALLDQVGGKGGARSDGEHPDATILLWAWGWAGNTKHIAICWTDQVPSNQIATLDGYRGRRDQNGQAVFRHIDENWYIWTDL